MSSASLRQLELDQDEFLDLLDKAISYTDRLQNNPPALTPQEDLVADLVVAHLKPLTIPDGPLDVRKITYKEGRSNVVVKLPGSANKSIAFVGSHMDVVPANPEEWKRNPFQLAREDDKLFGRGVTDCLGHVCMLTCFFKALAKAQFKPTHTIAAVFIANEEASAEQGIGIDELVKQGELDFARAGPLFWVDSADFGPTLGTAGMCAWQVTVSGKKFHSGLPHKGINSIELAMEVVQYLQKRFYEDFTKFTKEEKEYLFSVSSSFKPTQIATPPGSINQIPGSCTVSGDMRLTPFYNTKYAREQIEKYIADLDVKTLPSNGASRYHLPDEALTGKIELKWLGSAYEGVAVRLDSPGYQALHAAIAEVNGKANPFSLTGSLPIIKDLQDSGFDVQCCGFGCMAAYHANDEYGFLSDFQKGFKVAGAVVEKLEQTAQQ
jgi:acetylornithine deacetylase